MKKSLIYICLSFFILTAFTSNSTNYVEEGFKAFKAKNYQQAIGYYDKALKKEASNVQALNGKGVALAFSGKPKEGLKYINKALQIKPNYWTAYFNAGLANELAGNYTAAILAYKKIIAHDAKNTWSHYGIACAYGQMGNAPVAVKHLKNAIGLDKNVKIKARTEKDFNKIRKDKRFLEVIK